MNEIYEEINDPGLEAWVILVQDSQFNSVTPGYCKQWHLNHPISMRLLYDPSGDISIYGGMETSIISDEDGVIVFEGHSDAPALIEAALIAELADVDGACWTATQCGQDQYCVPLPHEIEGYQVSVCAEICTLDGETGCPEGKTCEQLQPGQPNGACLAPEHANQP